MPSLPALTSVSTKQQRIAQLAQQMPHVQLRSVAHHIDLDWMHEAYRRTRKGGAPGIDGVVGADYATNLDANLRSLLDRAKNGDTYRAPPVRRVYIPKGNGGRRPLGIPTFEDKVLQRAVVMALEGVYEQDFLPCSYGFRPGRSALDAVARLDAGLHAMGGAVVVEIDIEKYFDTVVHNQLQDMLRKRIADGVVRRLVGKWLRAGVLEEGRIERSHLGTPQGGVISPLLANIYLHTVLDTWFVTDLQPTLKSKSFMVRYADDAVLAFRDADDARRALAKLEERFTAFGLKLHPVKTRIVSFRRPPREGPRNRADSETFDFLGFTHYWGLSRNGTWVLKRKTAKDRLHRGLRAANVWLRMVRHDPISSQHARLQAKMRGHYQYFGVIGNYRSLQIFSRTITSLWSKWLGRRSQRLNRQSIEQILARFRLPPPRILRRQQCEPIS